MHVTAIGIAQLAWFWSGRASISEQTGSQFDTLNTASSNNPAIDLRQPFGGSAPTKLILNV